MDYDCIDMRVSQYRHPDRSENDDTAASGQEQIPFRRKKQSSWRNEKQFPTG